MLKKEVDSIHVASSVMQVLFRKWALEPQIAMGTWMGAGHIKSHITGVATAINKVRTKFVPGNCNTMFLQTLAQA